MSTVATPALRGLASDWSKLWTSATISGILPDEDHLERGGYHCSRQDNPKGNYSIVRPDDKLGPANAAAAIDMTMSTAHMIVCTKRLVAAYTDLQDPRRKYLNAFNGTTDGKTAQRWDVYARKLKSATPDHTWHVHLEVRRRYVNSPVAMAAVLSILKGEKASVFLSRYGVSSPPVKQVSAPPFPGVLRRNDRATKPDSSVRSFQAALRKRGWTSQGPSDGYFGAKLESAVKKWQAHVKLPADGVIGPKTWPTPWTHPIGS